MPRKRRKQLVGPEEDLERAAREQGYRELEDELHVDWREDQPGIAHDEPLDDE